jgi:hypothetical protein
MKQTTEVSMDKNIFDELDFSDFDMIDMCANTGTKGSVDIEGI